MNPIKTPSPMTSMALDVTLRGGLAFVSCRREFRNDTARPVEAVLTFPMATSAVVSALKATVDGRELGARAQARVDAQATYDDALERGKLSVLHEEALKGLHVLTIGNLGAGAVAEAVVRWVQPLTPFGTDEAKLVVPMTVDDVYGTSPLADHSDLVRDSSALAVCAVTVDNAEALDVRISGVKAGHANVTTSRCLEITSRWPDEALVGQNKEGRVVHLRVSRPSVGTQCLDAAVLLDVSGSMTGERYDSLLAASRLLDSKTDNVEFWEFSNKCRRLKALTSLSRPGGGTELGNALRCVLSESRKRDIIIATDGLSFNLDVHGLSTAASEASQRIHVLLIGSNALDAMVGHLASLTGGHLVATGDNVERGLDTLANAALRPASAGRNVDGLDNVLDVSGVRIESMWGAIATDGIVTNVSQDVVAFASAMRLPHLSKADAQRVAVQENLVTHLTSFVVVDEAGDTQEMLPNQIRIPLAVPSASIGGGLRTTRSRQIAASASTLSVSGTALRSMSVQPGAKSGHAWVQPTHPTAVVMPPSLRVDRGSLNLSRWADGNAPYWSDPTLLMAPYPGFLPPAMADDIRRAIAHPDFAALKAGSGLSSLDDHTFVIAVLASVVTSGSYAKTCHRLVIRYLGAARIDAALYDLLGLASPGRVKRVG